MRIGKVLIGAVALFALQGCATAYREPQASEPHAIVTFQRNGLFSSLPSAWPSYFNGAAPSYSRNPVHWRDTFRIQTGKMTIRVTEINECNYCNAAPRYVCVLTFQAEAGESYFVSVVMLGDKYLYSLTATDGAKVAECTAPN